MIGLDTIPQNEEARLRNLEMYGILYTKPEPIFDQLAAITATMLNAPVAMINFVDRDRVWTKADQSGEGGHVFDRNSSLCSITILRGCLTVFEDVTKEFFSLSVMPAVNESGMKFYAAAPITTKDGFHIGSVCIRDRIARNFCLSEQRKLEWISALVSLEMHKRINEKHEFA